MNPCRHADHTGLNGSAAPLAAPARPLRVLLVDDHLLARYTTRRQLDEMPFVRVVGEATDGFEAVALAKTLAPDLVLMDICMPGMDGIVATQLIRSQLPRVRVIILSSHDEATHMWDAIQAGAAAYLIKGQSTEDFAAAIQKVFA